MGENLEVIREDLWDEAKGSEKVKVTITGETQDRGIRERKNPIRRRQGMKYPVFCAEQREASSSWNTKRHWKKAWTS